MKYKLKKINNHTQKSYGKYVAKAQHYNTITPKQLEEEIAHNCSATQGDCIMVLCELAETLKRHLQAGDKVELPYLGTVKLEILSSAVDNKKDFDINKHIKGVRAHLLPKSTLGVKDLSRHFNFTSKIINFHKKSHFFACTNIFIQLFFVPLHLIESKCTTLP